MQINWYGEPPEYTENPDDWIFLWKQATVAVGSSGNNYLQYVPASKPFDHAWFEVLEAVTLYCTWSDNR
jgi:hypothetical protein